MDRARRGGNDSLSREASPAEEKVSLSQLPLLEGQENHLTVILAAVAAFRDKEDVGNDAGQCGLLTHDEHAGHGLIPSNALEGERRHGVHVMR